MDSQPSPSCRPTRSPPQREVSIGAGWEPDQQQSFCSDGAHGPQIDFGLAVASVADVLEPVAVDFPSDVVDLAFELLKNLRELWV